MSRSEARRYWNENIEKWGEFYLHISHSHERLAAPRWLSFIYKHTIMPIEARLMEERYRLTIGFIDRYVRPGVRAIDVGCGTGVFTVEMLKRGAKVVAVDFAQASLDATRALVEKIVPNKRSDVEYQLMDVTEQRLPDSDCVLAMGVTPYLDDLAPFYANILPTTRTFYCLILDPSSWPNRVRRLLPMLNVRKMHWFSKNEVDRLLAQHGWRLIERKPFASGYLDLAERIPDAGKT